MFPFSLLALLLPSATAATLSVDGVSYRTIGDALDDAVDGDVIEVAAGTWYECLVVTKSVRFVGLGGSGGTTLDGGGVCDIVLDVQEPATSVEVAGFTVTAPGGQALQVDSESFALDDVVVTGSGGSATTSGAGLAFTGTTLSLTDATFSDHEAETCAALDIADGAVVTMSGGGFSENEATDGAGGAVCVGSDAELSMENVSFTGNDATGGGLALDVGEAASVSSTGCTYQDNRTTDRFDYDGGAVWLAAGAVFLSSNDTFDLNYGADGAGIAARADGVTVTVSGGVFTSNSGAAVEVDGEGTTLSVVSSTFSANGGDIRSDGPPIGLEGNTFEDSSTFSVRGTTSPTWAPPSRATRAGPSGCPVPGCSTARSCGARSRTARSRSVGACSSPTARSRTTSGTATPPWKSGKGAARSPSPAAPSRGT